MSRSIFCLLSLMLSNSALLAAPFSYSGRLESVNRDGSGTTVKEFQLQCYPQATGQSEAFFQLAEDRPALPWIERFGITSETAPLLDRQGVAIGYQHLDRNYVLPVALPYFKDFALLGPDASWRNDQGDFSVVGEKTVNGVACWEVKATTGIARTHQLFVSKSEPIIEAGKQTVFMGPGDRFRISFHRKDLTGTQGFEDSKFGAAANALIAMQERSGRDGNNRFEDVTGPQLKLLMSLKSDFQSQAKGTALETFAKEISEELTLLASRKDRIGSLAKSMVNQAAPKFTLLDMQSNEIPTSTLTGKTIVLHFWDYANPTLEQPYGQVGYLDFINTRWADKGVAVYGVAINSDLTDSATRGKAIRNIQKLKQFMKLGYEIAFDGGAVLNAFGNPTRLGEELPLWIVISSDGNVVHYQTGFYEVDNRVGLKQLDDAIGQAVK